MDFLKNLTDGNNNNQNQGQNQNQSSNQHQNQNQNQYQSSNQQNEGSSSSNQNSGAGGSFFSGIGDKLNAAAGGGKESEKNEDLLDKGVDFVQEKFLGQGPQDNESAVEQAKDEQISDFIRGKYKATTGGDFPIQDKETRLG